MKLSRFYRHARQICRSVLRGAQQLRRMCVSLLTITMAIAKIIELVASHYSFWFT